jgi:adenylate kinase family enzyme
MIVVLIGPPGAGKTEQGRLLHAREHAVWVSMGALLRRNAKPGMADVIKRGDLVDDEYVNQLVQTELESISKNRVVILDGYPRHIGQADWLIDHAHSTGRLITTLIHLKISKDESLRRLSQRGRFDDSPEVVGHRYDDYMNNFAKIIDHFVANGVVLSEVDGERPVEVVFNDIDKIVYDVHQSQNR